MAPPRCIGLLATIAQRPALDARQRGDHAAREARPQLEHGVGGRRCRRSPRARRRRAGGSPGRRRAAQLASGSFHAASRPWKYDSACLARRTASASSAAATSMTPFSTCIANGPTSSAATTPRPPPSIIAGPPMPMLASGVAMMMSQQPSSAALPAKQLPDAMPMRGTTPDSRAHSANAMVSSPATIAWSVSPGRPPPPSVKNTVGRRSRSITSKSRSFLRWPITPCVPGQHGVVVREHRAARASAVQQRGVDVGDAGDQPVRRACAR